MPESSISYNKARIIIVEDEFIVAMDIKKRLISSGYKVVAAVSTAEACFEQIETQKTDIVLMDIVLTGDIDGITAAEIIKERYDIPVVFLTGHADEDTLKRAKITVPYGYILKPVEIRELQSNIELSLYRFEIDKQLHQAMVSRYEEQKERTRLIVDKLEEERARISRELHDSIGQMLYALKFNIEVISRDPHNVNPSQFQEIKQMIKDANQELKNIIYSLRPEVIETYGLKAALEKIVSDSIHSGNTNIYLDYDDAILRFEPSRELNLFRIIQEAVTNAKKHSGAEDIWISIVLNGNKIDVRISDNGKGLCNNEKTGDVGFGIMNMKQRAEMLQSNLEITSSMGEGTELFFSFDYKI